MSTVGCYEAKTTLPNLIERVRKGETITITKRGVPVAELVPVKKGGDQNLSDVIEELAVFHKGRSLKGITIRQLVEEGRRC